MLLVMLERCHQGLGNQLIQGVPKPSAGVVMRRERLDGILSRCETQLEPSFEFWNRTPYRQGENMDNTARFERQR